MNILPCDPSAQLVETPRILVIDAEKRIADTLALILRSSGYVAEVAYDGPSALAACSEYHPDLVISDVVMPGMSGIDVALRYANNFLLAAFCCISDKPRQLR